jgi:hypothetical protein
LRPQPGVAFHQQKHKTVKRFPAQSENECINQSSNINPFNVTEYIVFKLLKAYFFSLLFCLVFDDPRDGAVDLRLTYAEVSQDADYPHLRV